MNVILSYPINHDLGLDAELLPEFGPIRFINNNRDVFKRKEENRHGQEEKDIILFDANTNIFYIVTDICANGPYGDITVNCLPTKVLDPFDMEGDALFYFIEEQ